MDASDIGYLPVSRDSITSWMFFVLQAYLMPKMKQFRDKKSGSERNRFFQAFK